MATVSPIKALRLRCLECCAGQRDEVKLCECTKCPSWPYRFGKKTDGMKEYRPVKACRAKCMDCSCGHEGAVRECIFTECPLYPFRMGHNPNKKRNTQEEDENG